ncbi:MAG: hypothetical protein MJE68_33965 [Proteobacteria bacterium]|nr:hypothetical protein [Pseudomonadota bacterium]
MASCSDFSSTHLLSFAEIKSAKQPRRGREERRTSDDARTTLRLSFASWPFFECHDFCKTDTASFQIFLVCGESDIAASSVACKQG